VSGRSFDAGTCSTEVGGTVGGTTTAGLLLDSLGDGSTVGGAGRVVDGVTGGVLGAVEVGTVLGRVGGVVGRLALGVALGEQLGRGWRPSAVTCSGRSMTGGGSTGTVVVGTLVGGSVGSVLGVAGGMVGVEALGVGQCGRGRQCPATSRSPDGQVASARVATIDSASTASRNATSPTVPITYHLTSPRRGVVLLMMSSRVLCVSVGSGMGWCRALPRTASKSAEP